MAGCEMSLETRNGGFAGLAWRRPGAPRVLCLHGWLDNAASYVPLAPHLASLDLVALDFAGHGHSPHRPRGARYYFMDNLWDVDAVLDALGWSDCHLVGHSMGGALACVFAAAAPERVDRLAVLDGLGPMTAQPGQALERLRKSRDTVRKATGKLREFSGLAAAIEARRAVSDLSELAARLLCERSLEPHEDHFRWRTDPRLNWHSPSLLSEFQVLEYLAAIEAPVLSINAQPLARWIDPEIIEGRRRAVRSLTTHAIDGHHHFHMERPEAVAPLLLEFLTEENVRVHTQD